MYDEYRRPGVVTAAAVLLYISAGLNLLLGLFALLAGAGDGLVTLLALVLLAMGVVWIVLANRIREGSRGARTAVIVLLSISCVLSIGDLGDGGILSIGLNLLVIGLLAWNRDAQDYFDGTPRRERIDHGW